MDQGDDTSCPTGLLIFGFMCWSSQKSHTPDKGLTTNYVSRWRGEGGGGLSQKMTIAYEGRESQKKFNKNGFQVHNLCEKETI